MNIESSFRDIQKRLRAMRGRALTDLAACAGVSRATIYHIRANEAGRSVQVHTLIALERTLTREKRLQASNYQKAARAA